MNLSIYRSIYLSIYRPICLSVYLFIYLGLSLSLSLYIQICKFVRSCLYVQRHNIDTTFILSLVYTHKQVSVCIHARLLLVYSLIHFTGFCIHIYTSTPQLPFKRPHIPSNREHKALARGTLGGLGTSS